MRARHISTPRPLVRPDLPYAGASTRRVHRSREPEHGQVLVVFALALVALLGFAGLALDGGSTFAQRRVQQTAADLAALAAANDDLIANDATQATDRARTV